MLVSRISPAAVSADLPLSRPRLPRIDRHHHALAAEFPRRLADQLRPRNRGRIDAALIGSGQQQPPHILGFPNPAPDRQRQKNLLRGPPHHVHNGVPILMARGNIEERQLIRAGRIIQRRLLHRITGVAQTDKIDPLHHPPVLHVQARDDPQFQHESAISYQLSAFSYQLSAFSHV
jgi:hypothetical protein